MNKSSTIISTKGNLMRVQSTKARINKEDYISLDPAVLRDKVPKKQRRLCLPSEKRQLLMGKYANYTESSPKSELLQTFDSVWHQTLSVKSVVASKEQDRNRLLKSTTRFSPIMTFESSAMRQDTIETSNFSVRNSNNIQFGRSKDALDDDAAVDSSLFVSREVYNSVSRELKDFESLLKDFYKMVSHTEKSYWKAQTQQSELHHFVTVFVKEITELEKVSKEPKLAQLEFCLENIKHKIREIEGHQELIQEQVGQIKKFLDTPTTESGRNLELSFGNGNEIGNINTNFNPKNASTSPLTVYSVEGGVQPVSALLAKSSATAKPSRFGLVLDLGQDREDDKRPTSPELFGKMKSKTNQIKEEVKRLQSERTRFIINMKEERTSSVMSRSSKHRAGLKNWPTESGFERNEDSLESSNFTFKNDQGLLKSHILYDLNQSNEGLSNSEGPQSKTPAILLQDLNNQEYVQEEKESEEQEVQTGRAWDSAVEYYEMFVETLQSLEKALSERIKNIKVLAKDLESPWSKEERNSNLPREVEKCFSNTLESIQGYQQYFIEQRTKFLKEVFRHFNSLSSLSRSNLLKLDSLKNLVQGSIKKLFQAEKYSKKYTYYDLEDKKLREKYEKHYEKLKAELSTMHKTLMFLSEQFGVSISLYKLNPIAKPSKEEIENSKGRIETILKGVSYLRNIPPLDDEYNEKTTKAYQLIKELYQKNQVLTRISSENQFTAVESVSEANQSLTKVKKMSISIQGLKNNLEVMSKNGILQILIEKPLVITIKLSKKLDMSEKELKKSIQRVQDQITGEYEKLIELCEQIENQVELHTKRILNNKEHLVFSEWKQIFQIFVSIKEDIEETEGKIEKFMDQDLFVIGTSLPKPAEKTEKMQSLKKRVEAVMKTLATADMLNSEALLAYFADLRTSNLKQKLQGLSQAIEEEISNKQKLRDELDIESVLVKRIVEEVIQFLRRLKSILNKAFELDEKVAKEYEEFNAQFLEATQQPNHNFLINEYPEEFQPKLYTLTSLHENGSPKLALSLSPSNMKRQIHLRKQSSKSVAKMMMSGPEQSEHQCSEQVSDFIGRIKSLFKELIDDQAVLYREEHVIFFEIFNRFQSMSKIELDTLGKVKHAIEGVQKHYTYYDKMIRPLSTLYKCIDLLPQWEETSNELAMMKWKMLTTYQTIRHFEGDQNVRGGVEAQLIKYCQIQEILISSLDIVSEIFSNAEILNEKKFKPYLGNHIRVEEGSITEFINQIEKVSEKVMRTFRSSPTGIERDTMDLSKKFMDYMKDLVKLLKFTQTGYGEIFRIISEGVKPHEENLIKYLEAIYNSMKNLTDIYCDGVNELAATAGKPVWIVKSLDDFYREVILKDLKTFANLWESSKEIEEYLVDFQDNFVELEIKQKAQYRRIAESNPTKCDLRLARVTELAQNLNFLMFSEELMYRANLKQILMSKHKYLLTVKKICSHFAMIYSMGRKVYDRIVQTLSQKDITVISQELFLIERMLQDMIIRLEKASVESKTLGESSRDLTTDLNIKKVIKHDILSFYIDIEAWVRQLKVNLTRIVNFHIDLKRNFKGWVLLLRDDWISFIREWFANTYLGVDDNLKPISNNYQDFREKIEGLLKEVKKPALEDVNITKGVVDSVQYLNGHFFQEWFFNSLSEEKHHFNDKLSPEIAKFSDLVRSRKYNYEKLLKKCKKLHHRIEKCDKVMRFLNTKQNVTPIFENGIKAWEIVQDYYRVRNFKGWLDLLVFVQNRILISPDNESKKMNFKEIVQSLDGLYLATEREIKCELTKSQKDFLSILYDWIQTQVFGESTLN